MITRQESEEKYNITSTKKQGDNTHIMAVRNYWRVHSTSIFKAYIFLMSG